jgi:hypothetical protein
LLQQNKQIKQRCRFAPAYVARFGALLPQPHLRVINAIIRIPVNRAALKPYNSYGEPDFVTRGYYEDVVFICRQCQSEQIWLVQQQQWWFEIAKGDVYATAIFCRACRILRQIGGELVDLQ